MVEKALPPLNSSQEKSIALGLLPFFLRRELVEDRDFRNQIGLDAEEQIVFGKETTFARLEFFEFAKKALAKQSPQIEIKDKSKKTWIVSREQRERERPLLKITSDTGTFIFSEFFGLLPDRQERLREFDEVLNENGFPVNSMQEWRDKLDERPLTEKEIEELSEKITLAPLPFSRALRQSANKAEVRAEDLVPSELAYFEYLIGEGGSESFQIFSEEVLPALMAGLLSCDGAREAHVALLLCTHPLVSAQIADSGLEVEQFLSLALWARDYGDLFSKVGVVEASLSISSKSPQLEGALVDIVRQIVSLDPTDNSSQLHLLTAMIVLVESEVCRNQTLHHLKPFQRRIATFAHASLLAREAADRVDVESFCNWAMHAHTQAFLFRNLLDLREEPRWRPEDVHPIHLKQELLGRLFNVAELYRESIPEGPLRDILATRDPSSELNKARSVRSFFPGPIEGAESSPRNNIPQEIEAELDQVLSLGKLTSESVALLSYATGLFNVDADKADRAVEVIRKSNFRFADQLTTAQRMGLIQELAAAAGRLRNADLASSVRAIARVYREESGSWYPDELLVAFVSAGAFTATETWMDFIGGWVNELCLQVSKEDAPTLEGQLSLVCSIEPVLRRHLGQGLAALKSIQ
ncbi:hypothetical protein [Maritimibacter dapengensis]|uniref:Uncharacterized protein n=1 Tax=Maritimibacter dapengensis TaxID=2836868 RepID=A0ABS6T0Q1_9RHOB|nr:hypothetical protein [Maritimibacter dapengensis]MBV7378814.1 hypothetical protein [Maritimibacter dapengensis]